MGSDLHLVHQLEVVAYNARFITGAMTLVEMARSLPHWMDQSMESTAIVRVVQAPIAPTTYCDVYHRPDGWVIVPAATPAPAWVEIFRQLVAEEVQQEVHVDAADLKRRFDYHPPVDDEARKRHELVRSGCHDLATYLNSALPEGREKSTAITKLEEVMFWSNAAIARPQPNEGGQPPG